MVVNNFPFHGRNEHGPGETMDSLCLVLDCTRGGIILTKQGEALPGISYVPGPGVSSCGLLTSVRTGCMFESKCRLELRINGLQLIALANMYRVYDVKRS